MVRKRTVSKVDSHKLLRNVVKISGFVWVVCVLGVFMVIGYVVGVRKELFDKSPLIFTYSLLGFIVVGCLAFIVGAISFSTHLVAKGAKKKQNNFIVLIKLLFILPVLPLYLLIYIVRPLEIVRRLNHLGLKDFFLSVRLKFVLRTVVALILTSAVILPIWIAGYLTVGTIVADQLGYTDKPVNIVGTGSMYPTWAKGTKGKSGKDLSKEIVSTAGFLPYPNGIVIGGKRYFGHVLGRGDIIAWENDATRALTSKDGSEPAGLLKRIIGLPGDTIEIKDGIVYLNREAQKEAYIAKPRSTFGEKFLKECETVTVPKDAVFAMGDNRKGSSDSREIGFAPISDIRIILPLEKQKGNLDKNWHDATNDLIDTAKPTIDRNRFIELLNEKRKEHGVTPVTYEPKLDISAKIRGEYLLKHNTIQDQASYEVISNSMTKAGYWNSYVWEWSLEGYYDADELIEDYLERDSSDAKNIWYDKKFDDIGIGEVPGMLNGCPTQLIVVHAAGYIPATYSKEVIESWKTALGELGEILPSWETIKDYSLTYHRNKQDADRLFDILRLRISHIQQIVSKMEKSQWLTAEETRWMNEDEALNNELASIAKKLNALEWQH